MPTMPTLADPILTPARSAGLVIDVQNDVVHPQGWAGRRGGNTAALLAAIPRINALIAAARQASVPAHYVGMEHGPEVDPDNYRSRYHDFADVLTVNEIVDALAAAPRPRGPAVGDREKGGSG